VNDLRWIPLAGQFDVGDNRIIFRGGLAAPTLGLPGGAVEVGNLLCNQHFGGGTLEATIAFAAPNEQTACGLMLFYQPATQSFIEVQLGGQPFVALMTWANGQWTVHGAAGFGSQLQPNRLYHLRVAASGSGVAVSVDGVNVLSAGLPFPLPRGQAGIWCKGDGQITIEGFQVRAEKPRAFVVMQFTAPFNELYAEVIRPVCEKLGFIAQRADESFGPGLIIADIERQILDSQVVVADITPQNPNVYYEVGYAHTLRKPTILIAESPTKLPFDVSPFRTLFYENSIAGKSRVEAGLRMHLEAIAAATGLARESPASTSLTSA
jgi:hypothetical protein